ncbi:MAG: DUF6339 family protein [Spirochaetales bacterium]
MKLIALKQEALDTIKNVKNREALKKVLLENKSENWLQEFSQIEQPYMETKIKIEPFEFDMSSSKPIETDFENSKRLFLAMKDISETQASDERLWAGLAFNQFYDYMQYRWPITEGKYLDYRYFQNEEQRGRRGLMIQGLSRLWWIAKYTYDENLEDNFIFTKLAFKYGDMFLQFTYRNFSTSSTVTKAFLSSLEKFNNNININSIFMRNDIIKYISLLGGIYILDFFTEEELQEKIYNKMMELYNQKNEQVTKEKFKLEG